MATVKVEPSVVVAVALSQVGYHEKASNSQLDENASNYGSGNYTKYARDLDALGNFYNGAKNGFAWCDVFVDWCFVQAYGVDEGMSLLCQPLYSTGAGCIYSANFYKAKGQYYTSNPKIGDQIFFYAGGTIGHTGIVVGVSSSQVITVEGNSSDQVAKRSYNINNTSIAGYGRPNYNGKIVEVDSDFDLSTIETQPSISQEKTDNNQSKTDEYATVKFKIIYYGQIGIPVKRMQSMLISAGYSCGRYKDDGEYGNDTKSALLNFQRDNGLEQDGICGVETMYKLLGG